MATTALHAGGRVSLRAYVDHYLGPGQPWWRQTWNVLVRPLPAPSFAGFWRSWNPVWGYYLRWWCYRPARLVLPRLVTVWFVLYGTVTVVSDALGMDTSRLPAPVRLVVNLAYLAGCYLLVSPLLP
jgi:hypothetical protein